MSSTAEDRPDQAVTNHWWSMEPSAVADALGVGSGGLTSAEAAELRARYGPNELAAKAAPSWWRLAFEQMRDPMNLMLLAVAVISTAITQFSTALVVGALVIFNIVSGAAQQRKARRSVDALATMQVPHVRVRRDGSVVELPAVDIVPGDVIELEAGDIVPADARIVRASTLEAQEAALTGESAPVEKSATSLPDHDVILADRRSMVFQNTAVTRGTASALVVGTGMDTEMGKIATMLATVERSDSPLQRELSGLTRTIGIVAWAAVVLILILGIVRGQSISDLLFLGTAVAISAIPTGMPTFVQRLLAWGANKLAESKAIVASLNDVETLGATSAICSDKTGTLTMNQMTARSVWCAGETYVVDGEGYSFDGAVRRTAGADVRTGLPLAYALALPNDATVSADGVVIGDPTEAAFVVLAEKLGVDVASTKAKFPRLAEVPFDSDYKFMATFHRVPWQGKTQMAVLVKGAPDVILKRSTESLVGHGEGGPIEDHAAAITAEIERLSADGLRTLSLAVRLIPQEQEAAVLADPMGAVSDLTFVGVVGIVDPLRAEAKVAVTDAQSAGIEIRMITGDHVVTAAAIGKELGLEGEGLSGEQLAALSDDELDERLPHLTVFGRVTPQDKLRLVQRLQHHGHVVAMTGDAVNDAAAIKQADIGVAMGSGSEVTKQAAKLVLTDDNFATLVQAVRLGRVVYAKVSSYITFQMTQLVSLIVLFLTVSIFNINQGVALTPLQVLVLNFAITIFSVMTIMMDKPPTGLMSRPPRDTSDGIASTKAMRRWGLYGGVLFIMSFLPILFGQQYLEPAAASVPMTMTFVIVGFGTSATALALRRDPEPGITAPIAGAAKILMWPVLIIVLSTELPFMSDWLQLTPLSLVQWLACIGATAVTVAAIETDKWAMRRRLAGSRPEKDSPTVADAVAPARARN
ncbi:cation-translocating P-type ATPase [Demequina oxidasica]|uniref:cation-translocating P-type ATPase n=1 Tax=Demequina oxidasica TaxID=676199 RepID=UPI0007821583|nr:cation-transporting P-type ATPase [Demequina oxidasica]